MDIIRINLIDINTHFISIFSFFDVMRCDQHSDTFLLRNLNHIGPNATKKKYNLFFYYFLLIVSKKKAKPTSPSKLDPSPQWVRPGLKVQACESSQRQEKFFSVDLHSCFSLGDLLRIIAITPTKTSVSSLRNNKGSYSCFK